MFTKKALSTDEEDDIARAALAVRTSGRTEADVKKRLALFRAHMERMREQSSQFCLVALKTFIAEEGPWVPEIGKHPDGVPRGTKFSYRVELIVCGIHSTTMRGIDYRKDSVARSVVLSMKYHGVEDNGKTFTYAGEGGRGIGKRPKCHQEWKRGNSALLKSMEAQTPVRVIRGMQTPDKDPLFETKKQYVYDGLYVVKNAWSVISNGYRVCIFHFEGINGHHTVSGILPKKEPDRE